MQIDKESLSEFGTNNVTVGTTPMQMQSLPLRKGVYLTVGGTTATVTLGKTTTCNGFEIKAGETSPMLFIDDLSKLFLVSTEEGTTVTWIGF
jgi:hypothetical protein